MPNKRDNLRTALYLYDINDAALLIHHQMNCRIRGDKGAVKMCQAMLGRWPELKPVRK